MTLALIHLKLCRKFQLSQLLFSRDIIVTMSLFFIVSIFIAFRINGIKKDRLNNFRCGLRRMSSNSLVYHIYRNEGDLRHTFEHCRSSLTCNGSYMLIEQVEYKTTTKCNILIRTHQNLLQMDSVFTVIYGIDAPIP